MVVKWAWECRLDPVLAQSLIMDIVTARQALTDASHAIYARGWVPATSGNFSVRLDDGDIAITSSGKDKGRLTTDNIMVIGPDGTPREDQRPSAETSLHLQLYARDPTIGSVLHTHSATSAWASQRHDDALAFDGLEILKAFDGIDTHDSAIRVPIFANTQDIDALAADVEEYMLANGQGVGYLIAGHGVYTWAKTVDDCLRHLETLEYLFDYLRIGMLQPAE